MLADAAGDFPRPTGAALTAAYGAEEICPPGEAYSSGVQTDLYIFLTFRGRASLDMESQTFTHEANTIIVTAAGCAIRERVDLEQAWGVRYLSLRGEWADRMSDFLRQRYSPPVLILPNAPLPRRRAFNEMFDLCLMQTEGWQWGVLSRGAELFGGLFADALHASPGDALLLCIGRFIDADPEARPTVAQIAAQTNLTPRQLLYRFPKIAGEPLALWIRKRRITTALRLLGQGQSVTAVAQRLGFANPYHFSRAFKAVTGQTPSAVRTSDRPMGLHRRESGTPTHEEDGKT